MALAAPPRRAPRRLLPDQRAELTLGALVCCVLAFVLVVIVFVFLEAWPSFSHNGLAWFGGGGNPDQQIQQIFTSANLLREPAYTFHAWPIIWGTLLVTGGAVALSFFAALFVAVFVVEFAPEWMRRILEPVVRLLASVPSVIFGLVGVLVLVPFIGEHVITDEHRRSVSYIVSLSGYSLLAGVLILSLMIAPLMIAVFADGLRAVPRGWLEGSLGLGINRWRTFWKIGVRTARPALVAGTVLATARALGEAVMLAMVTGGVAFAPNPADGVIFFLEPTRPLAATILQSSEELTSPPMRHTIFAIAAVLLFSAVMLSLAGWAVKQPMKRYGVRA
ncbi:PstC family ABC transporter permease [Conexibacter woesei]|uniref:Binding-protein-dependent transport systems inner membrane component n=1 Tax=Conexibacter woesei (strain DSM 14684 / CCUG 47730 / CIP 108061 / JCM 11494 / NBRC 100937 / ID131577) TaxID=469383 RepID=D3FCD7_CONWI|nr:ABC transporter permease subunit [Conexibacter woesei]ADB53432.1 binding-protein-dependent transport systems inner membrane component [Conexibacter woesei DSM 14684]